VLGAAEALSLAELRALPRSARRDLAGLLATETSARDPVAYARDVLRLQPWARQVEILEAVADHPRVAVRSGHKIGKSTTAVALALWFTSDPVARPAARVVMTSASARQVRSILWRELRRIYGPAKDRIGGELHKVPDAGLQWDDGREILGFSTDEPEKMAGISGEHVLFILDEASGIPAEIFEAIEGNRAGGARVVLFGNPTQTSGEFFDAFHGKAAFYRRIHVSSEETPNVVEGRAVVPGLATREWIDEKRAEWGEESPLYQVRAKGNFPEQASNAVVGLALVLAALARWADAPADGPLECGLDVARTGEDESVLALRRGAKLLALRTWRGLDGPDLAAAVVVAVREAARPGERPRVKVDAIGVGASAFDALARCKDVEAVAVNSAGASSTPDEYANLRAQLAFGVRAWLRDGGALPDHDKLQADLVTPTFGFDARNRILVESKDDIRPRLRRSPDYGDAAALAIYQAPAAAIVRARAGATGARAGAFG
jgi:hypothetical protein